MGLRLEGDDEPLGVDGPLGLDAPGPDERDMDLMDGTWEQKYYSGRVKTRNWNAIGIGLALLVVAGLVVPMILVVINTVSN
jgi:hypothetical protein